MLLLYHHFQFNHILYHRFQVRGEGCWTVSETETELRSKVTADHGWKRHGHAMGRTLAQGRNWSCLRVVQLESILFQ
jgi:hypothetical protein